MPRHTRHDGSNSARLVTGQVVWLPPQQEITVDTAGLSKGCFNHPAVVLEAPSDGSVVVLIITSFHGTDLSTKYPNDVDKRKKYLPISPADPHPDLDGALLTLTHNHHLPKKSWVNLAQSHTLPAAAVRSFSGYYLTRASYRLLAQHAPAAPTSGHGDAAAKPPRDKPRARRAAASPRSSSSSPLHDASTTTTTTTTNRPITASASTTLSVTNHRTAAPIPPNIPTRLPTRLPNPATTNNTAANHRANPEGRDGNNNNNKGTVAAVLLATGFFVASVLLVVCGGVGGVGDVVRRALRAEL